MRAMRTGWWLLFVFAPALAAPGAEPDGPPLPTLPQAFGAGTPGAGGVGAGTGLYRIDVDLADYPDARCADDTGAVFYVRRSSLAATTNRWLIFLQGGGLCPTGTDCAERWKQLTEPFGANKLSSSFAPPVGIVDQGIELIGASSSFSAWNHVFVYYCSSDLWLGRRADFATSATITIPPNPPVTVPYRINLLGASILDAVIGTLRREQGQVTYTDSGGMPQTMPDLDNAAILVFAGTSAGGAGVMFNADRLFATLTAGVAGCETGPVAACPLRFAAVVDAAYPPDTSDLDWSTSPACNTPPCSYAQSNTEFRAGVYQGFYGGDIEASCAAFHPTDAYRCVDFHHVVDNHVTSPLFVRMDLQDPLIMSEILELALRDPQGLLIDETDFAQRVRASLVALPTMVPEEPRNSWLEPRGAFGPQCGDHESLRNASAYFDVLVPQGTPQAANTDAILANWLSAASPAIAVEPFTGAGVLPFCPENLLFSDGFE